MNKTITAYQCGKCADGTVKLIRTETRFSIAFDARKCDKCGTFYGLKNIQFLTPKKLSS